VPTDTATYFKEHPDVAIPSWLSRLGFTDQSWHNDAMPKMELTLATGHRDNGLRFSLTLVVWVNYDDPGRREIGPKWMVEVTMDHQSTEDGALYHGEDEEMARQTVIHYIASLLDNLQPLARKVQFILETVNKS